MVGKVFGQVVALFRTVGLLDEPVILGQIRVPVVGLPAEEPVEPVEALLQRPRRLVAAAGDVLGLGSLRLEIVSPAAGSHAAPGADPNQRALVILARSPGLRLLLTADAESDALAPLALSAIDVLKVSHHGSADEALPLLLERIQPRIAVIEVGARNSYGHPAAATLGALSEAGAAILRTDKDGTVRIDLDSSGVHVQRPT